MQEKRGSGKSSGRRNCGWDVLKTNKQTINNKSIKGNKGQQAFSDWDEGDSAAELCLWINIRPAPSQVSFLIFPSGGVILQLGTEHPL